MSRQANIAVGDTFVLRANRSCSARVTDRKQMNGIWHYHLEVRPPALGWTVGWLSAAGIEINFRRSAVDWPLTQTMTPDGD